MYVTEMNGMVSGMVEVLELALIDTELYVPRIPGKVLFLLVSNGVSDEH